MQELKWRLLDSPVIRSGLRPIIAVCAFVLCGLIYIPGLTGKFIFDDWQNIVLFTPIHITELTFASIKQAAEADGLGISGRPLSMVSFALNYYFSGLDPYWFKLTNLVIHIATGLSLFSLGRLLIGAANRTEHRLLSDKQIFWCALTAATLWMVHPLNLTAVLYIVQRMASLASLFSVLALISYCKARERQLLGHSGLAWLATAFLLFFPAATWSKQTGFLAPVLIAVVELTLYRFKAASPQTARKLKAFYSIGAISCIAAIFYVFNTRYGWLFGGYTIRDFNMYDRLLTEARVLWMYLKFLIVPNIGEMTLYHDDIKVSRGLLDPSTTLVAIIGLIGLLGSAAIYFRKVPLLGFAILFFFAGHTMESTVLPLELVFEHRNYLPIYGIILLGCRYLIALPTSRLSPKFGYSVAGILIAILSVLTFQRATIWGQPFELLKHTLRHHPESTRTLMWAGETYQQLAGYATDKEQKETYLKRARDFYRKGAENNPLFCSARIEILNINAQIGISREDTTALFDCLRNKPVQPGTVYALAELTTDLKKNSIQLPRNLVHTLYSSFLSNRALKGGNLGLTYGIVGQYLRVVEQNPEGAIEAYSEAVKADQNNPGLWVSYARVLIENGENDQALAALENAEKADLGHMTKTIASLRKNLAESPGYPHIPTAVQN